MKQLGTQCNCIITRGQQQDSALLPNIRPKVCLEVLVLEALGTLMPSVKMLFLLPLIVLSVSTIFLVCSPLSFVLPLDSLAQTPSRYQTHISVLLCSSQLESHWGKAPSLSLSLSFSPCFFISIFDPFALNQSFCFYLIYSVYLKVFLPEFSRLISTLINAVL